MNEAASEIGITNGNDMCKNGLRSYREQFIFMDSGSLWAVLPYLKGTRAIARRVCDCDYHVIILYDVSNKIVFIIYFSILLRQYPTHPLTPVYNVNTTFYFKRHLQLHLKFIKCYSLLHVSALRGHRQATVN